jgi:hypothetical protein
MDSQFDAIEPVGTCYYARDGFTTIKEFAPCRQEPADQYDIKALRHGNHRFGYGMCGFSAAIPESEDDRLYIGAPGVWYWQGALFVQNVNEKEQRPNTLDGPGETDHSMLGRRSLSSFHAFEETVGDGVRISRDQMRRSSPLCHRSRYRHKILMGTLVASIRHWHIFHFDPCSCHASSFRLFYRHR